MTGAAKAHHQRGQEYETHQPEDVLTRLALCLELCHPLIDLTSKEYHKKMERKSVTPQVASTTICKPCFDV
jgi:hypothetical protein